MNVLKKYYIDLLNLKYSEENIAELFSITNNIIKFLKSQNPKKTNQALHYIMLSKRKEFQNFKDKQYDDQDYNFKEAKFNLMSDLTHYCKEYWDPEKDPWNR